MLKTFYLSLFLISCFLLVYYIFLEIKSKNFSLKKNKIIANKNIATAKNNNRKKILLVVALFIAISIILNVVYAIMITLVFAYYIKMNTINKKQKDKKEIDKQIVEVIRLFRNAVSSGESVTQTIESISNQTKGKISIEFKEISNKIKLGISLDNALKESCDNIKNEQYKFFVDSIRISNSTGIKISDILSKIEESINQKLSLTSKVDVLTSQVRFSGSVISFIPFFIVGLIYFVEPNTVSVLFTTFLGNIILLVCVIMILVGSFVMKKIVDIKL